MFLEVEGWSQKLTLGLGIIMGHIGVGLVLGFVVHDWSRCGLVTDYRGGLLFAEVEGNVVLGMREVDRSYGNLCYPRFRKISWSFENWGTLHSYYRQTFLMGRNRSWGAAYKGLPLVTNENLLIIYGTIETNYMHVHFEPKLVHHTNIRKTQYLRQKAYFRIV